jgi:hypothetical protein|nr:MAG TPA: hypothetical protein [Caudoviricetes sp.]
MKYIGQFRDIKEELYTVNIITNNDPSATKQIVLGSSPLIIKGKSDGLYSPLKLREATITIVNETFLFDLYSSTAHGTKVEVYNEANTPIFIGYVTPNAYNQGYSSVLEEIEIQAVDGVSTLEYFNYETGNKTIVSFLSIIDKCLEKCGCYSTVIYPKSMRLDESDTGDFLSQLYISENNFFDDDPEQSAWELKDVLSELLNFLGWSLTVHNNEVILLDYDYIKTGGDQYWKHSINGVTTTIQLSDDYAISAASHRGTNASLSLSDTFNQISIKANLYPIKNAIPDFWQDDFLTPIMYNNSTTVERKPVNNDNKFAYLCKFFTNKMYKQSFYKNTTHQIITPSKQDDEALYNNIGCCFAKVACYDMTNKPATLKWDNMIMFSNGVNGNEDIYTSRKIYDDEMDIKLPVLEVNTEYQIETALQNIDNKKSYFILQGDVYSSPSKSPFVNSDSKLPDGWKVVIDSEKGIENFLIFKLQVGGKFWNGTKWTTAESTFCVNVGKKDSNVYYNYNPITNNVVFTMGLDEEGWAIPVSNEDNLFGKVSLTIYRPHIPSVIFSGFAGSLFPGLIPKFCTIRNLKLGLLIENEDYLNDKDNDNDVKYVNVINENFTNKFEDLELKINSQASKEYSFSSVMQKYNSSFIYNKGIYNVPLNKKQLQEYNVIEKMYNHFSDTKKIISMTIENVLMPYSIVAENNLKTTFVVDTQEIDYANNTTTVTLNEV